MTDLELVELAKKAMENAYAPYSKFKVGAALLAENGKVYTGCNIENSSFGATNCAERTAIFKAISEGERNFVKMAIVSSEDIFTYPCGICRQVISELAGQIELIFEKNGEILVLSVNDVLPYQFKL